MGIELVHNFGRRYKESVLAQINSIPGKRSGFCLIIRIFRSLVDDATLSEWERNRSINQ